MLDSPETEVADDTGLLVSDRPNNQKEDIQRTQPRPHPKILDR
jgi:hypothetical protein